LLRTYRSGVGAVVGHDLVLEVTDWSADLELSAAEPGVAGVRADIDLRSIRVRSGQGVAPLTDRDRDQIVRNAAKALDSWRHPTAVFASDSVSGPAAGPVVVSGMLSLHGVSRPMRVDVRAVTESPAPAGGQPFVAVAVVVQSEYGIRPYVGLLGALRVRDAVDVEVTFRLP
jgi:polyisoprenoid-binding protein YceI